ncbi:DUF4347 domain-containing protein [Marinobacter sp. 1-4A]|uniref:DUF4347 domain-containing protein n=1 Tax=Marinobacter sp. 1-4A TaxID=2582919 RepID=UPI0019080F97|nr:DUF4347 domain-containing protein [Marinobacter sp. 1-4A]MBK1852608.1 DUF4347 domain-containing protein [Marinobacter sp. 1-4A]
MEFKQTGVAALNPALPDLDVLVSSAKQAGLTPIFLTQDCDSLTQLVQQLKALGGTQQLHLFCHGQPGRILLGNSIIDAQSLPHHANQLRQLGQWIGDGCWLYSCETALGDAGQGFISELSAAIGTSICASTKKIGGTTQGAHWQLNAGPVSLSRYALEIPNYKHTLAATTLTFTSDDGNWDTDHIAEDGEGGSADIAGITIQILNISNPSGSKVNSINWFNNADLASGDGFSGVTVDFNSFFIEWGGMAVKSSDGSEFKFDGFDFYDWGNQPLGGEAMSIVAYRDGAMVAGSTVNFSANDTPQRVSQDLSGNSLYGYVDEVRILFVDGAGYASINNIVIDTAIAPNSAPVLGGTPADDGATEDIATAIDLSAYNISDADGDSLTLTLAVNRGTLASTDGNGTTAGVTIANSGTASMTLQGTAANLNTYLNDASKIQFTTAANDTATATLTVTPNDGTADGSADTVAINITAINDAPVLADTNVTLATIVEDAGDDDGSSADGDNDASQNTDNGGDTVADLLTAAISDPDGGAVEAIAVTQIENSNGVWQYSTDSGTTWNSFSGTTGSSVDISNAARLLDSTDLVRFVPDANYNGTATFAFRAWDTSTGVAGNTADTSTNGGSTAFSSATDTASVSVLAVNDEPTLTATGSDPTFTEGGAAASLFSATSLNTVEAGQTVTGLSFTITNVTNGSNERINADGTTIVLTHGTNGSTAGNSLNYSVTVIGTTATVTMTGGNVSVAAAETLIDSMSYQNNSNSLSTSDRVVTLTSVQDSGGTANGGDNTGSLAIASTVTMAGVNDAPTLTATGQNPTYTEGGAAPGADLFSGVTADTVDSGQTFSAMTLTVTNVSDGADEVLRIDGSDLALTNGNSVNTATNGLTVSSSVSGSTATISLTGATLSETQMQTLVDGLAYRNTSDTPTTGSNRVITITGITDSGGTANGGSDVAAPNLASTVSLTAVNDAPVVGDAFGETSQIIAGAGAQSVSLFNDVTVTNADSVDYNSGFLTLAQTAGTTNGNWSVDGTTVTSGGDATVSAGEIIQVGGVTVGIVDATDDGQSGNDLTISFNTANATNPNLQVLLQNLSYSAPSGLGNRSFDLTLNDADGTANGGDSDTTGSFTLNVTPNPPVISNLDGDSIAATEQGGAIALDLGSNATVTDADSVNFNGGSVTASVTGNADVASDVLSVDTSGAISLAGTTAGSNVSASGTVIGTLGTTIAAGNDFVVNLNINATPARVQALVQALTFEASGDTPAESTRTVNVTVSDGAATDSAEVSVAVTAENDAPQLTGLISDATFTEDTQATLDLSAATLSDVDTTGSVTLTLTASAGVLSASTGGGVTVGGSNSTSLTLNGTVAAIDTYLNGANISHTPAENATGNDAATISLSINDGGTITALGSVNIDITAVNDAPTAADDTVNVGYNGTHTVTASDFGFTDIDGDTLQSVRIDTIPANGTLALNGTPVVNTDIIAIADINSGLLTFTPTSGDSGSAYATLAFSVNDGTVFSTASNTLTFDVAAAPPPPPPPTDTTPPPTTTIVDGTPVEQQTVAENGLQVVKININPVSLGRQDTDSSSSLADIPLHFGDSGTVTTLRLPEGIGATARANETAVSQTSFRDALYLLRDAAPVKDWSSLTNGLEQWLSNGNSAGWLNQITFTSDGVQPPSQAIEVSGVGGDATEIMILDARQLPAGTVLNLNNIEFAIIAGDVTVRGGSGSNVVFAGSGRQDILLGAADDELHGGDGDDTIGSAGGDDLLFGEGGSDLLFGGAGNDLLHGGQNNDTVTLSGSHSNYIVERDNAITRITHVNTPDETDVLINVETLRFSDKELIIEYDQDHDWLATLYTQLLGRQADLDGFQYWARLLDQGASIGDIVNGFLHSTEFVEHLGANTGNLDSDQTLTLYYTALLGRDADDAGYHYWQQQLIDGASHDDVLAGFILSEELTGQYQQTEDWDFFI